MYLLLVSTRFFVFSHFYKILNLKRTTVRALKNMKRISPDKSSSSENLTLTLDTVATLGGGGREREEPEPRLRWLSEPLQLNMK